MLLAIESTEVPEENQNGRAPKQSLRVEDFAVRCSELEVQVDPHRIIMRPPPHPYVIAITEESPAQSFRNGGGGPAFRRKKMIIGPNGVVSAQAGEACIVDTSCHGGKGRDSQRAVTSGGEDRPPSDRPDLS